MQVEQCWGLNGALAQCRAGDIAVVHDVLSFSTTVSVVLDAGAEVLPFAGNDESAMVFAAQNDAMCAARRGTPGQMTLSPLSIRSHFSNDSGTLMQQKLVLPSPNGSTISANLAARGLQVLTSGLRNASVTAKWLAENHHGKVVCISAGERWPDDSLRPAVEDLMGAGMLISEIKAISTDISLGMDAAVALASYRSFAAQLVELVKASASGRELIDAGFADDVNIACELNESRSVAIFDQNRKSFKLA